MSGHTYKAHTFAERPIVIDAVIQLNALWKPIKANLSEVDSNGVQNRRVISVELSTQQKTSTQSVWTSVPARANVDENIARQERYCAEN